MKIILQISLAILFISTVKPAVCLAQEQTYRAPLYEHIEQHVQDSGSPYYYLDIVQRFLTKDTTLSVDDFHYLYYGFVFQKVYERAWEIESDILAYLKEVQAAELNDSNYDTYIQLSEESLRKCPVNSFALNMLIYLYGLKNDEATSQAWAYMAAGLTNTMFASGDGKTCETGFHIVLNSHISYFMELLGVTRTPDPKFDTDYRCTEIDFGGDVSIYFNTEKVHKANWDYIFRRDKRL